MKFFLSWKRLLPFRRPLKQIAAPVVEVMKADETSVVVVSGLDLSPPDAPLVEIEPAPLEIAAAPDPQPVAEIDTPATLPLPPATIPLSLPPPAYPDDWMRARAMYFSSAHILRLPMSNEFCPRTSYSASAQTPADPSRNRELLPLPSRRYLEKSSRQLPPHACWTSSVLLPKPPRSPM